MHNLNKWHYYNPKFEYEKTFFDLEWPWAGHKYFAYDLIANIKPKVIVELGTHMGTSFFSMCQSVKDNKLKTKLYAIDSWNGDKQAGFYDKSVFIKVKKIKHTYYKSLNVNLLKTTFDRAINKFTDHSIDVLHIDGLHTYKAVKHDFENWFNKVAKDGIIMFHDTYEKKEDFGVYKLWDELKKKYCTIEFLHSHGLGILFLNKKICTYFNIFFTTWQNYYYLVSENILLKKKQEKYEKILYEEVLKENIILKQKIKTTKLQIRNLDLILNKIKSAKFFKVWQVYCKIKNKLLKIIN